MARTLPPSLTAASWDKQKGVIAKMAGETGVGAQLKKVESCYKVINWEAFDAQVALKRAKSTKDIDDAIAAAKKEYGGNVEKLRAELVKTRDLAKKVSADFTKKKLLKSSVTAADTIASDADHYYIELKSMDAEMKAFEAAKSKVSPGTVTEAKLGDIAPQVYKELKAVSISANGMVKTFASSADFTKGALDGHVDAELAKQQAEFAKELKVFAVTLNKFLSAEGKVMKITDGKKIITEMVEVIFQSFHTMKPGMRGAFGMWSHRQEELAKKAKREGDLKSADLFVKAGKLGTYLQGEQEVHLMKASSLANDL